MSKEKNSKKVHGVDLAADIEEAERKAAEFTVKKKKHDDIKIDPMERRMFPQEPGIGELTTTPHKGVWFYGCQII